MHTTHPAFLHLRPLNQPVTGPIDYAFAHSQLGLVLVGRSAHGICCILFGASEAELQQQLTAQFAQAAPVLNPNALADELAHITAMIDHGFAPTSLSLDVGGTPFQQQVWQALCAIPPGQTRSYKDIAQILQQPDAVRAVAKACAANVIAAAVPCHRIIGHDGQLSGYRWGVARKRALLATERSA